MISRKDNLLFVEGQNDLHVVASLLKKHSVPEPRDVLEIIDTKSYSELLKAVPVALLPSDLVKHVGIIVDADTSAVAKWLDLKNILLRAGYSTVPDQPMPHGTVVKENEKATVGIWIMPDNTASGMLEHFVSCLIPPRDTLWEQAQQAVQEATAIDGRFKDADAMKANIHTWLAWQEDPGTPMGWAITKRYLDPTNPNATAFIAWLRTTFEF